MAKKGKAIRDVKGEEPKQEDKIQVIPGNISILTVRLLNSINVNLIELRKEMARKNG